MLAFNGLTPEVVRRFAVDALHLWSNTPMTHGDLDNQRWLTDTQQIVRDLRNDLLIVQTPSLQALAGRLDGSAVNTSILRLASTTTHVGTLTAESLDGKPLSESGALLLKRTSTAYNDQIKMAPSNGGPKSWRVTSMGAAPIRTDGKPAAIPDRVELNGKLLIEIYLQYGTWEYLTAPDRALLYLDTGNIAVNLPEKPKLVRWHTGKEVIEVTPDTPKITIPTGVRLTEIVWDR